MQELLNAVPVVVVIVVVVLGVFAMETQKGMCVIRLTDLIRRYLAKEGSSKIFQTTKQ